MEETSLLPTFAKCLGEYNEAVELYCKDTSAETSAGRVVDSLLCLCDVLSENDSLPENAIRFMVLFPSQLKNRRSPHTMASFLHCLCKLNLYSEVKNFLDSQEINVNIRNDSGSTPLIFIGRYNCDVEIAKLLINCGATIDAFDSDKNTVVHYAAQSGNTELFKYVTECATSGNAARFVNQAKLYFRKSRSGSALEPDPTYVRAQETFRKLQNVVDTSDATVGSKARCNILIQMCAAYHPELDRYLKHQLRDSLSTVRGLQALSIAVSRSKNFIDKHGRPGWQRYVLGLKECLAIDSSFSDILGIFQQVQKDLRQEFDLAPNEIPDAIAADNTKVVEFIKDLFESCFPDISELTENVHDLPDAFQAFSSDSLGAVKVLLDLAFDQYWAFDEIIKSFVDLSNFSGDLSALELTNMKLIGKGQFTDVYSCEFDGKPAAVKHFLNQGQLTKEFLAVTARELHILRFVNHSNVAKYIGFDVTKELMVCELGVGTLHDLLYAQLKVAILRNKKGRYSVSLKARWLAEISDALRYLHIHGFSHSRLSPRSVLLIEQESLMIAKVTDLGFCGTYASSALSYPGSLAYRAPEYIDGISSRYSPAADIYAFGVLANELLTEKQPWSEMNALQIKLGVSNGQRPQLYVGNSETEKSILTIIGDAGTGCLCADPGLRPVAKDISVGLHLIQYDLLASEPCLPAVDVEPACKVVMLDETGSGIESTTAGSDEAIVAGYPVELFAIPPRAEFICGICKCVLRDPKQCPKGHMFCTTCITTWLGGATKPCPLCKEMVSIATLSVSRFVNENIRGLEVVCSIDKQCPWRGNIVGADAHLAVCPFVEVKCDFQLCNVRVPRSDKDSHMRQCKWRNVSCQYCSEDVVANALTAHETGCESRPAVCTSCNARIKYCDITLHTRSCLGSQHILVDGSAQLKASDELLSMGPHHLISFGRTGSGKSWLCNRLTALKTFKEGSALESVTASISSSVAWNGDICSDCPGFLDTQGQDAVHQASIVDYINGKSIRAILFVFTDRLDLFSKAALDAFRDSNLKDNIILIFNKDLDDDRPSDIGDFEGFPVIYVKARQPTVDVLKAYIDARKPTLCEHLLTPVGLFKNPIKILRVERIYVPKGYETITVKETVTKFRQENVNRPWRGSRKWYGKAGKLHDNWVQETFITAEDVFVERKYKVSKHLKLTYAERFDGQEALYKREELEEMREPVNSMSSSMSGLKVPPATDSNIIDTDASGYTTISPAEAATLVSAAINSRSRTELTALCFGKTVKLWLPFDTGRISADDLQNARPEDALSIGVHNNADNQLLSEVKVIGCLAAVDSGVHLVLHASIVGTPFKISLYGPKRLKILWQSVELFSAVVEFEPAVAVRLPRFITLFDATNNSAITSDGFVEISSHDGSNLLDANATVNKIMYDKDKIRIPDNLSDTIVTVSLDIAGYSRANVSYILYRNLYSSYDKQEFLSPANLAAGEWRVVLTWGRQPGDLDLFCKTNFNPPIVYWGSKNYSGRKNPEMGCIELDVDVRNGNGPETITFTRNVEKRYRFFVHNFTGKNGKEPTLAQSGAKVMIHDDLGNTVDFCVPTEPVVEDGLFGTYWHVFDLIGEEVRVVNKVVMTDLKNLPIE